MKLKNIFRVSIIKRLTQVKSWVKFKIKHPNVPIINPLIVGTYYSQYGQDLYLSTKLFKLLDNSTKKNIVDIGANHPIDYSNSYFFEKTFQSKVYAIEPISTFENSWKMHRPNATFLQCAIGSKDISEIILNIPSDKANLDNMFSSVLKKTSNLNSKMDFIEEKVPCFRLTSLFERLSLEHILFISIDVEGYELEVLHGINFDNVKIDCFLIENNTNEPYGSEPIRDFMKTKGYVFLARIYCADDVFVSKEFIKNL